MGWFGSSGIVVTWSDVLTTTDSLEVVHSRRIQWYHFVVGPSR